MLQASKALRKAATTGKPLPEVAAFGELYLRGVRFRASQMILWTGRPKAGKSNAVQYLCHHMGLPTLYFALDMDPFTAAVRHAAMLTGDRQHEIAEALQGPGRAFYEDVLADTPVRYCFDTAPHLPDIAEEIDAWVEVWDEYPQQIVFDNLLNIDSGGDTGSHYDYKFILRELQKIARHTHACIHVMHHALENTREPARPPKASDTDNKVNQLTEMILSVAKDPETDRFFVAPVLVRNGRSDPNADHPICMYVDFDRMQFNRYRATPQGWRQPA